MKNFFKKNHTQSCMFTYFIVIIHSKDNQYGFMLYLTLEEQKDFQQN